MRRKGGDMKDIKKGGDVICIPECVAVFDILPVVDVLIDSRRLMERTPQPVLLSPSNQPSCVLEFL